MNSLPLCFKTTAVLIAFDLSHVLISAHLTIRVLQFSFGIQIDPSILACHEAMGALFIICQFKVLALCSCAASCACTAVLTPAYTAAYTAAAPVLTLCSCAASCAYTPVLTPAYTASYSAPVLTLCSCAASPLPAQILKLLKDSKGNILDDEQLINVLNHSKLTSSVITVGGAWLCACSCGGCVHASVMAVCMHLSWLCACICHGFACSCDGCVHASVMPLCLLALRMHLSWLCACICRGFVHASVMALYMHL